jgi:hypothetical protein
VEEEPSKLLDRFEEFVAVHAGKRFDPTKT